LSRSVGLSGSGGRVRRGRQDRPPPLRQMVRVLVLRGAAVGALHLARRQSALQPRALLRLHAVRHRAERAGPRRSPPASHRHPLPAGPEGARGGRPQHRRDAQAAAGERPEGQAEAARGVMRRVRAPLVLQPERRHLGVQRQVLGVEEKSGLRQFAVRIVVVTCGWRRVLVTRSSLVRCRRTRWRKLCNVYSAPSVIVSF
jgi:hypothetical protein